VSSELFQGLASLTQLSLEGNQIETIEPNAFKPLISLQKLNISVNQIKIFKSEHFTGLENNLRDLDISDNSIEEIELGTFKSLKLEKLKIY
jgi:Leucine-rich repeat (LRR) protein